MHWDQISGFYRRSRRPRGRRDLYGLEL